MPTYSFTRTREQLADRVLRKLGVLASSETADAGDVVLVYEAMDLRLKEMHRIGTLWHQVSGSASNVNLVAGTATASAPADFLFPVSLAIRIGSEDVPIEIVDHATYQRIPNKLDQGQPESVFMVGSTLTFWPVPDDNYSAKLTYEAIAADTFGATAPDIPVSMMLALTIVIAYDLRTEFGIPPTRASRIEMDYPEAMRTIMALNKQRVDISTVEMSSY